MFLLLATVGLMSPSLRAETSTQGTGPSIGDGRRISLREGEISISTTKGWEVFTDIPGLTLLMRAPLDPLTRYQRTIQIASFSGARYMDEITAKEFEGLIVRKFSATSATIQKFRIRNYINVEMEDGRPGLLFYSEFSANDVNLMQAHVLVSTDRRHFLITYTDVASHFEGKEQGPYFEEAWTSIRSTQLRGAVPKRFHMTMTVLYGIGGVILLAGMVAIFRIVHSGRSLSKDVAMAFDAQSGSQSPDPEAIPWTLPNPQSLKKKGDPSSDDDDLMVEDEVS